VDHATLLALSRDDYRPDPGAARADRDAGPANQQLEGASPRWKPGLRRQARHRVTSACRPQKSNLPDRPKKPRHGRPGVTRMLAEIPAIDTSGAVRLSGTRDSRHGVLPFRCQVLSKLRPTAKLPPAPFKSQPAPPASRPPRFPHGEQHSDRRVTEISRRPERSFTCWREGRQDPIPLLPG
jgi:hypothetical protein